MQPKGTTLNGIEALQWAMMRDLFHEAILTPLGEKGDHDNRN
jgi:pyrroline-5-carboxylate reductase